ncbi:hypothetical protein [Methylosoma difficile]
MPFTLVKAGVYFNHLHFLVLAKKTKVTEIVSFLNAKRSRLALRKIVQINQRLFTFQDRNKRAKPNPKTGWQSYCNLAFVSIQLTLTTSWSMLFSRYYPECQNHDD